MRVDTLKINLQQLLRELAASSNISNTDKDELEAVNRMLQRSDYRIQKPGQSIAQSKSIVEKFLNKIEEDIPTLKQDYQHQFEQFRKDNGLELTSSVKKKSSRR